MSSSAYFASRHGIITWINQVTHNQLTKIEQLGSGNIYCQILDAAYPEKVPIHKVKWNAYLEIDFIHNFKILQTCFERLGITKTIDVLLEICRSRS